ncbi:MAG: hypothetical protein JNK15_21050 [Planctomycetes bacterium]|nr:hypothetical protein [Planctomycetota bacterium]
MFDRFIRMARAKKALREQRFEDALLLALDPVISRERAAEQVRNKAASELLDRGQRWVAAGDFVAARAAAERVRAALGSAGAADLLAAIDAATARDLAAQHARRQAVGEARRAVAQGDLAGAEAALATAGDADSVETQRVRAMLADRRQQAAAAGVAVDAALAAGQFEQALELLQRAEALDRDHPDVVAVRQRVAASAGAQLTATVAERLSAQDLAGAFAAYRQVATALPTKVASVAMRAVAAALGSAVRERVHSAKDLESLVPVARAVRTSGFEPDEAHAAVVDAVLAAADAEGVAGLVSVAPGEAYRSLRAAAEAVGATGLVMAVDRRLALVCTDAEQIAAARASLERGELDVARATLVAFLADHPLHEGARTELAMLERSFEALDLRLAEARTALKSGQLRQACAIAMSLQGAARVAADAAQVVAEARGRMGLVDRGLDEVRAALHGRATATQEGVRHCLLRLEALAKVQTDHEELGRLAQAVASELEALGLCERISRALDGRSLEEVQAGVEALQQLQPRLLSQDRLQARWLDFADRIARMVEVALLAGRLDDVARSVACLRACAPVVAGFEARIAGWDRVAAERRDKAAQLVQEAHARLAERDLAEAERLVEEARQQWLEGDDGRRLADELARLRQQNNAIDRIESLARDRDFATAQQKLAALHTPSPLLRTRIYDMKLNLAKSQGLEGAFLLRVDEGGERLVVRGEGVTIGNIRQNRSDLPVLAHVAGRHASIRRSMSFHGGMQDRVVAEEGEVAVGGRQVKEHVLAAGDRVQLGPALAFAYQRPTTRSLTVALQLQGGFQIAGTDRILLMKDRGRDGRILMGPSADVHVRVARATGEVELFTTSSGQVRVACATGGTIDGVVWKGEHPLAAGQMVEAAGITFHVMPWRPSA